jgi:hypothetical protein
MYLKLNNGVIEKYPYTLGDLRQDNPQVSFPKEVPSSLLNEYGVFEVETIDMPLPELNQDVSEGMPQLIDGKWKQNWVIAECSYEKHLSKVLNARKKEYPPMGEYLDAVVKNDQAQIDKYIADCLAVKAKYPKP